MDPKTKNATQPFVYHTNKAVTKARERDFPSLSKAPFFMSLLVDLFVNIVVAHMNFRHVAYYELKEKCDSSYRHLLVLSFYFPPILQCEASFRSSPSASASIGQIKINIVNAFKTKTKTSTTTTTKTTTTKTTTRNNLTTTATTSKRQHVG